MARTTPGTGIPVPESPDPRTITADLWASFSKVGTLITQTSGESSAALTASESAEVKAAQALARALAIEEPVHVGPSAPTDGEALWVDTSEDPEPDPGPVDVAWGDVTDKPATFPSTIPLVDGLQAALVERTTARIQVYPSALTGGRVWVQRTGSVVYLDFEGAVFGTLAGTQQIDGVIPTGFRTTAVTVFSTVGVYGPVRHCRTFGGNGGVQIFGLASGDTLQAHVVYRATDPFPTA